MRLADEVLQHLFRSFKIRDDTIAHRPDRYNIAGCSAQHLLGALAYGFDLICDLIYPTIDGSETTMPCPLM